VAATKLPDQLVQQIHELAASGLTKTEVSARTGVWRGTVAKYWPADVPHPEPVRTPVETESERWRQEREKKLHQEAIKQAAAEVGFRAFIDELVRDAAEAVHPGKPVVHKTPKSVTPETMHQSLCDWHWGELVTKERTLGLNEYNASIARSRVRQVIESHLGIKERLERGGFAYPRLVVAANGDMVSGTIHDVEKHTDPANIVQASIDCGQTLGEAIRDLAQHYEAVEVFGTVGNHGRLPDARKLQDKEPCRSWDYLIYRWAEKVTSACPNVQWFIPDAYSVIYEVEGWRFLQDHGSFVKSWNNIPFYGIKRRVTSLNAIRHQLQEPIHYSVMGHFHQASANEMPGGEVFVSGSLKGPDEFSVNHLGQGGRPSQLMFGVHPGNGVTGRWPIYAEGA
jgi:hypothetical protein